MRYRVALYRARPALACIIGARRGVDGGDDLLRGDALQVGAGRGQVRVPPLALDQRQRDALTQQLDSVRMAELGRREAPADPRLKRDLVQLQPGGAGRPGVPARGSSNHAQQRADRQRCALGQPPFER
jgi:hypothetical protein